MTVVFNGAKLLDDTIKSVINQTVHEIKIPIKDGYAVSIVLAAKGYPEKYDKNINNLIKEILLYFIRFSFIR